MSTIDYDSYSGVADITLASYSGLRHNTFTWDRFFGNAGGAGGVSANTDVAKSSLENITISTGSVLNYQSSVDSETARLLIEFDCQGGNADLYVVSPAANYLTSLTIELINRTYRDIGAVIVHYGTRAYQVSNLYYPGDVIQLSVDPDTHLFNFVGDRKFLEFSPILELGQVIGLGDVYSDIQSLHGILTVKPAPLEERDFGLEIRPDTTSQLGDFIARTQIHTTGVMTISVRCLFNSAAGWPQQSAVVGGAVYIKESVSDKVYGAFVQTIFDNSNTTKIRFSFNGKDASNNVTQLYNEFSPDDGWATFKWCISYADKTIASFYNGRIVAKYRMTDTSATATTIDRVVVQTYNNSWVFFKDLSVEHQVDTLNAVT